MTGELKLQGAFNIGVQGVAQGAEVKITQILANSYQYNDLVDQINILKELLSLTPAENIEKRFNLSEKINSLEVQTEQFKKNILLLAEQFERIEINTDRLRRAREHFDQGEIDEARSLFESDSEAMQNDQKRLLEKRAEFEENILPKLRNSAEEYLLSALLAITDYKNPNRYHDAIENFKLSIKSLETKENLFKYATLYLNLNRIQDAEIVYERFLNRFGNELVGEEVIQIYINLGVVYLHHQNFIKAEKFFELALELLNGKDAASMPGYRFNLAALNGNLAVMLQQQLKFDEAYQKYKQTIRDLEKLAGENSLRFAPPLVDMQSNLGYLLTAMFTQLRAAGNFAEAAERYQEAEAAFKAALKNIRLFEKKNDPLTLPLHLVNSTLNYGNLLLQKNDFAAAEKEYGYALELIDHYSFENPQSYLPKKATILNSFGVLKEREEKFEDSQKYYEQAVALNIELFKIEPLTYVIDYCRTAVNLADSYAHTKTRREDSISGAVEVLAILYPVVKTLPYTMELLQKAWGVTKKWDFSEDEIKKRVSERMKQMQISQ